MGVERSEHYRMCCDGDWNRLTLIVLLDHPPVCVLTDPYIFAYSRICNISIQFPSLWFEKKKELSSNGEPSLKEKRTE